MPDAEYVLSADQVLVAVAQRPASRRLPEVAGVEVNGNGTIRVDDTGATSRPGVFAAGDAAGRPGSVIEAIAHGKKVALAIDGYLRGETVQFSCAERPEVDTSRYLRQALAEEPVPPVELPALPADERRGSYDEIELPLTEEQAIAEAKRCLACGCGVGCGLCREVCIYEAIRTEGDKHEVDSKRCDGCGLCAHRCPSLNISMVPVTA